MADSSGGVFVPRSSQLFTPLQTAGLITAGAPVSFSPTSRGNGHVAVSLDKSYYIMDLKRMAVAVRSPALPLQITAIFTVRENTYLAFDSTYDIVIHHQLQELGRLKGHSAKVAGMLAVGDFLISWTPKEVLVWNLDVLELHGMLPLPKDSPPISVVMHPETYLNKIVLGFRAGADVQLWNFKTLKQVHSFKSVRPNIVNSITSMCLSSHPDIIGIANSQGLLYLLDLRADQILCEFQLSSSQGCAVSLTCLTDRVGIEQGLFVAGCKNGDLVCWDTKEHRMSHLLEGVHLGPAGVVSLFSVPEEPLVVSAGDDNSIILWIFEGAMREPRELRSRKGMQGPPLLLSFYDDLGRDMLCVGATRTHLCDVARTSVYGIIRSRRFPQRKALNTITKSWRQKLQQLPTPTSVAYAYSRHYDWGNIVTTHIRQSSVFVWSGHDSCLLARTIEYPVGGGSTKARRTAPSFKFTAPVASAVAVSSCGNFVCVGYVNGEIYMFNLQSGSTRGPLSQGQNQPAHSGPVYNLEILSSQTVVSASCSAKDFVLRSWDLKSRKLRTEMQFSDNSAGQYIALRKFTTAGILTAVVLTTEDWTDLPRNRFARSPSESSPPPTERVVLVDLQSKVIVREFPPLVEDEISCIEFTKDGRWILFTTRISNQLYVYDILSSTLIDWVQFPSTPLAFTTDPATSFLYVSLKHLAGGIAVFANSHIFDPSSCGLVLRAAPSEPIPIGEPVVQEEDEKEGDYVFAVASNAVPISQLEAQQLTLSTESAGRIQAIVHLDQIKERNKPKNVVIAAPNAPFFLPSALDENNAMATAVDFFTGSSKLEEMNDLSLNHQQSTTVSGVQLNNFIKEYEKQDAKNPQKFEKRAAISSKIMAYLKSLSPSGIHLALTELSDIGGSTSTQISSMLDVFLDLAYNRSEVDFLQALLNVFLSVHSGELEQLLQCDDQRSNESNNLSLTPAQKDDRWHERPTSIRTKVQLLRDTLSMDWVPLDLNLHQAQCFLKYLTHCQME